MRCALWFAAGVVSVPAGIYAAAAVIDATSPGLQIECRGLLAGGGVCRWESGPIKTTPRLVARARWRWHKAHQRRGRCRP